MAKGKGNGHAIAKETLWNRSEKVDHLASSICKVLESSK